jgi:hypothetical protein
MSGRLCLIGIIFKGYFNGQVLLKGNIYPIFKQAVYTDIENDSIIKLNGNIIK